MTTITLPRAVVEQALHVAESAAYPVALIKALRAALAQQTEPAQEPAFHGFMSDDGTQVDVCFSPSAPRRDGTYATAYYTAPPHRVAQQAEPDHETRAELAEQQVVQLAEERDHYRNLWQKAQQDEPAQDSGFWGRVAARQASRIKQLETAVQQALEVLKFCTPKPRPTDDDYAEQGWKEHNAAIASLRAAMVQE